MTVKQQKPSNLIENLNKRMIIISFNRIDENLKNMRIWLKIYCESVLGKSHQYYKNHSYELIYIITDKNIIETEIDVFSCHFIY